MFALLLLLGASALVVLAMTVVRQHHKDDCPMCGASFRPDTDMPCHTDDFAIWAYAWTSEERMLKAFFPEGFFVDETDAESVRMNHPDKSAVLTGCNDLTCGRCQQCRSFEDYQESYNEWLYRNKR